MAFPRRCGGEVHTSAKEERGAEVAKKRNIYFLGGALAGTLNGLFGGGGGIPFVLLTTRSGALEEKKALATCVAIIFPLCAVSAAVYFYRTEIPLAAALPYLAGGFFGGIVGGKLFRGVSNLWLRRIFALFLLYGGVRYLL